MSRYRLCFTAASLWDITAGTDSTNTLASTDSFVPGGTLTIDVMQTGLSIESIAAGVTRADMFEGASTVFNVSGVPRY